MGSSEKSRFTNLLLANHFSGPVLTNYVWWALTQAIGLGTSTIYFLARDGYLLCEIAREFCTKFNLNIDCRYLYCSRTALRMPSCHLVGEEAFDLLFTRTQNATLSGILSRAQLTEQEQQLICADTGLKALPADEILTPDQLQSVEQALRASQVFRDCVLRKSKEAYPAAIGYFRQEGLFDQENIVIVDSGWTGSMQRSLRQLLESAGYTGRITGLYFGMYRAPRAPEDGEYRTWYFDSRNSFFHRIRFNNNLFECLLSAPHGMTVAYQETDGGYGPVQAAPPGDREKAQILEHIAAVTAFAKSRLDQIQPDNFDAQEAYRDTRRRILRYMVHPTAEEAGYYGSLMFCDDVTEGYQRKLADPSQMGQLEEYIVLRRLWLKLTKQSRQTVYHGMFWPYGTMAFLPGWKRLWYRWNYYIWEWINHNRYSKK